jgi:PPOX class probable F420-dependent enzyme
MPIQLSTAEWRAFLAEGRRTAKVAVLLADGSPLVTPVWFAEDGGDVLFTTTRSTAKGRAVRRDPRVSVCVDSETAPVISVTLRGRAEYIEDAATVTAWIERIERRYGAPPGAYSDLGSGPDRRILIRVPAEHVVAMRFDA